MPVAASNLTVLDISCASVAGYQEFKSLMRAPSGTGHLFFRHGFDTPSEISVYLRGIGSAGAARFLTANIGAHLTLEFAGPADAHNFFIAVNSKVGNAASSLRLSAPYVVIEPSRLNVSAISQTLKTVLLKSAALQKVLPQYENLGTYIHDLLNHEHAFRDEYMADFTFEKIAAAITEETFPKVVEYTRRHSPDREDAAALALELSAIYGILIEERECRYPALGAIAKSLTDPEDLADVAELQTLIEQTLAVAKAR